MFRRTGGRAHETVGYVEEAYEKVEGTPADFPGNREVHGLRRPKGSEEAQFPVRKERAFRRIRWNGSPTAL